MAPFPIPEIKRVALESVALTLKVVHNDVKVNEFVENLDWGAHLTRKYSLSFHALSIHQTSLRLIRRWRCWKSSLQLDPMVN